MRRSALISIVFVLLLFYTSCSSGVSTTSNIVSVDDSVYDDMTAYVETIIHLNDNRQRFIVEGYSPGYERVWLVTVYDENHVALHIIITWDGIFYNHYMERIP